MYTDEQIRQVILEMGSDSRIIFVKALSIVRDIDDKRFFTNALAILESDDSELVNAALITLKYLSKFHSIDFLHHIFPFLNYPSHCVNAIAVLSESKISDTSHFPKLYCFVIDNDPDVRFAALRAIDRLKYPKNERLEIALHLINDSSAKTRALACHILAFLKNPVAVDSIIAKLNDHEIGIEAYVSKTVSMEAITALQYIHDERAIEPIKDVVRFAPEKVANWALETLTWFSIDLCDFYSELLEHNHEGIRIIAVHNLSRNTDVKAIKALIAALHTSTSKAVQEEIITALHKIGSQEAHQAINNWKIRTAKE